MTSMLTASLANATESIDIHVTGSLSSATCSIVTKSLNLGLDDVMISDIASSGYSEWADGEIVSSGCNGVSQVTMKFGGTKSPEPGASDYFDAGVAGIAVESQADAGSGYETVAPDSTIDFAPKSMVWPVRARLVSTGPTMTAGQVSTSITVTINYT